VRRDIPTLASATLSVIKINRQPLENLARLRHRLSLTNNISINISRIMRRIITWYHREDSINLITINLAPIKA